MKFEKDGAVIELVPQEEWTSIFNGLSMEYRALSMGSPKQLSQEIINLDFRKSGHMTLLRPGTKEFVGVGDGRGSIATWLLEHGYKRITPVRDPPTHKMVPIAADEEPPV